MFCSAHSVLKTEKNMGLMGRVCRLLSLILL
jgi:hypothetical protein